MRKRIGDIAEIQIGYQFREKLDPASDGTHQVIQIKDIDELIDHRLIPSSLYRFTPTRDANKYEVSNGDIIFPSKGRRSFATLVEDLYTELPCIKPDGSTSTIPIKTIVAGYFYILRITSSDVSPDFFVWSINQSPAQKYLQSVRRGTGIRFIRKDDFTSLAIDIPNRDTQRQIVELHKLSIKEAALLYQLRNKRQELIQNICINATKQESSKGNNNG